MFSIIASRVPRGWTICRGLQTEHQDGTKECSLAGKCLGIEELHGAWRLCCAPQDADATDAVPADCALCGPPSS